MSRKRNNIPGAAEQPLRAVKNRVKPGQYVVSSKSKDAQAYNDIIKAVVTEIRAAQADSGDYSRELLSKSVDNTLDRVVFELDKREASATFTDKQLAQIKVQVQDALSEQNLAADALLLIRDSISAMAATVKPAEDESAKAASVQAQPSEGGSATFADKVVESVDDEKVGEYKDSTIASDFDVLQKFIDEQFQALNKSIKSIPGTTFGGISKMFTAGIGRVWRGMASLGKNVAGFAKNTAVRISGLATSVVSGITGGIGKAIGGISRGIGSVLKGIGGLGSKFKAGIAGTLGGIGLKIGGFFSRLNPFSKSKREEKAAAKKEALREKMLNFLTKVVDKILKLVEPFIKFVVGTLKTYVIIPITIIAIKIGLVIASLTLLIVGAYLVYKWAKEKISEFIDYVLDGELWDDCIKALTNAWEWIKDFGKWLLDVTINALKFIFVDIWVELGVWVWDKLVEFGTWLYDEFIYPWVVHPIEILRDKLTKFLEPILAKLQPFIDSFNNLKARITSIWENFKWDESKSFFENLKCLGSIVKDAVLDWWNTSPFKAFYEQHLEPIVNSVKDLIGRIKEIWRNFKWDESKSFFENMQNIAGILVQGIKDWWNDPENPIRSAWEKVVTWVNDMTKPIVEWYNNSALKTWIDKVADFGRAVKDAVVSWWNESTFKEWIDDFKKWIDNFSISKIAAGVKDWIMEKLSNFSISIPVGADIVWKEMDLGKFIPTFSIPIPSIKWKEWKPFGDLAPEIVEPSDENPNIEKTAAQQVAPAMQQLGQIQQVNAKAGEQLSEEARLYTKEAAAEKQQQGAWQQGQDQKMNQILTAVNGINLGGYGQPQPDDIAAAAAAGGMAGGAAGGMVWPRQSIIMENR